MSDIKKQIVTDEDGRPVAVQIAYSDWVALEARLAASGEPEKEPADLSKHYGVMPLRVDPMAFQQQARDEWP